MRKKLSQGDKFAKFRELFSRIAAFVIFRENKHLRFSCNRKIKYSDTVFLAVKKYQRRKKKRELTFANFINDFSRE